MAYVQWLRIAGMMNTDHVQLQVAALCEFVSAQLTIVRLFTCMRSIMLLQQIFKWKAFGANITLETMFFITHDEWS